MIIDVNKYGPWALVTGGSEGVGAEAARMLVDDGFNVVLIARKTEPLEALKTELEGKGAQVRIKSVDLGKRDALAKVREVTDDIEIGLLFYNAGANSVRGNFCDLPQEVTEHVINLNALGHADFSRHYGKLMCERGKGGMILTGSTGGYLGSSDIAAYCASKAFCRVLCESLWLECEPFGVDVCHLNIGFTATPAMARLGLPVEFAETPHEVARQGLAHIKDGPVWVVDTKGTVDSARLSATFDNRAEIVRKYRAPAREDTGKS